MPPEIGPLTTADLDRCQCVRDSAATVDVICFIGELSKQNVRFIQIEPVLSGIRQALHKDLPDFLNFLNPDLRGVRPPQKPKESEPEPIDLASLVDQL